MIKTVDASQLLQLFSFDDIKVNEDIIIIDIREPQEYAHEHIEGSKNVPINQLATLDPNDYQHKTAIFHCRSGSRTELNMSALEATPFKNKYCLSGGITAWKTANMPTIAKHTAPVDVMRQVQIIVGCMILLGVSLSYLVSVYFIILTIFAGMGLLVAGFTGFCGMAEILKFLPWNQPKNNL